MIDKRQQDHFTAAKTSIEPHRHVLFKPLSIWTNECDTFTKVDVNKGYKIKIHAFRGALVELQLIWKSLDNIYDTDTSEIIAEFNIYWRAVFYTSAGLRAKYKRKLRYPNLMVAIWHLDHLHFL